MAETEYKRLIFAAQTRAEVSFMALVRQALEDADRHIGERLLQPKSGNELPALKTARQYIRQDSSVFLRRIDGLFKNYLERAMQTMFIDLRPGLRNVAAAELTLIDDEVVNHQIEVGRLAHRMREATEESIGRLNVIIAQLHGQIEARERENPFRPYLLARALHEAVKTSTGDETRARLLFEHLSDAMVLHLPDYYASLRAVFETSGVHGKFVAQRSRHAPGQRYFGAPGTNRRATDQFQQQLLPGLKRLFDAFTAAQSEEPGKASARGNADTQTPSVQEFLRGMLSPVRTFLPSASGNAPIVKYPVPAANPLLAQLDAIQQQAARGNVPDGRAAEGAPGRDPLAAVRENLDLQKVSVTERMTIDVVALLFQIILGDQHIPACVRQQMARLHVPVLKAAVMEPELLHDEAHAARRLLNRIGSVTVDADSESADGRRLAAEVERLVNRILHDFTCDTDVFKDALASFERFLQDRVREEDRYAAQAIDVVESAERCSVLLTNAMTVLCEVLPPLNADKRITDFVIRIWPQVLMHAARQDGESGMAAGSKDSLVLQYRAMLPELIWSIQDKQTPEERNGLMRMLPGLVKGLRQAFVLIRLPEEEAAEILDVLVGMHTRILRGPGLSRPAPQPSLDELRQRFARVGTGWHQATWTLADPPRVRDGIIEDLLASRKLKMDLRSEFGTGAANKADQDALTQACQIGARFQLAAAEPLAMQLIWISTHRSLYLFKQEGRQGELVLFACTSLREALRKEAVLPLEYAPAFERAVESLLFGASRLAQPS
ncbi:DUF1631 family protein [Noviherbaspirillum aerium]|uniref:DUF1631 family protein n=1 Tax=Noviherbaspirillum aerium TaxID=2588497 RepID=UPI00124CAC29|nr:DUF1631 family protein [Noviherbaspirillum aerium]